MSEEMMSKNFLENKKNNQKLLFEHEISDDTKSKEGRQINFEELIIQFKEQLGINYI